MSLAGACTAVGSYTNSAGVQLSLAELWNGTRWAVQATAPAITAATSVLAAVSCTSPTTCAAVGSYFNRVTGVERTLVEHWNGRSWGIRTSPNVTGAQSNTLVGVSCTSANACTAVGNYTDAAGRVLTLAEVWNGSTWSIQTTPNPSGGGFASVSCTSAIACTAVGSAFAEFWNGNSWETQTIPEVGLSGVSCTSASDCEAVGGYAAKTLAEHWNGTTWTVQATPSPSQANPSYLVSVSCSPDNTCMAIGTLWARNGQYYPFSEPWNGTGWGLVDMPSPAPNAALPGVSCTSASACTAVGTAPIYGGSHTTLAEGWTGTGYWSGEPTRNSGAMSGVSCTSTSACIAVGHYQDSTGVQLPLAEGYS
jgi:hypothetical protein